jgi:NADH dehydrogenase (ubiquinone) Fe-S protein 4
MSSLRTTVSAARMLRSASQARAAVLPARRYVTQGSTAVSPKKEEGKDETSPMATLPRNSPDYSVPVDMATSYGLPEPPPTG